MANRITLARFPLLFVYLGILYFGPPGLYWVCIPLVLVLIGLDGLDGAVARWRGESSLLGSVLDIAVDRSVELILWVVYADLDLIPILIPIVFITRGVMVDAVRSVGTRNNKSAFSQLESPLSKFLVSSRFMRALYGTVKTGAFTLLTLQYAWHPTDHPLSTLIQGSASGLAWFSLVLCIIRGIPPLIESYGSLKTPSNPS